MEINVIFSTSHLKIICSTPIGVNKESTTSGVDRSIPIEVNKSQPLQGLMYNILYQDYIANFAPKNNLHVNQPLWELIKSRPLQGLMCNQPYKDYLSYFASKNDSKINQ